MNHRKQSASTNQDTETSANNISISGNVVDSVVIAGDNNTVNQTIIQKALNIFKNNADALEQRNRRILLNHVENAWIKGVLDASLYGAAMLDLGIKESPESVTDKYPWTIKKETTNETLPAGTPMLEIFDSIGMGRSLLILGAPGSGKTTILLELARQLIARAREDVTQPIPMVFNLVSWTEKFSLIDWLVQELNTIYNIPRKTAPEWVKENKLFLLLDGLDEVRQESRAKCVEAINTFRKEYGLTSLVVCSRSQGYVDLKAKLSFEGAIEIQPLTQKQAIEFFSRFGDEMVGIKQLLETNSAMSEMAETPLFLSIMFMVYRDKRDLETLVTEDGELSRKRLFHIYIERMFKRPRSFSKPFKNQDVLNWLTWLASKMVGHNAVPFMLEDMQPYWLNSDKDIKWYGYSSRMVAGIILGVVLAAFIGQVNWLLDGIVIGSIYGLVSGLLYRRPFSRHPLFSNSVWISLMVFMTNAVFGGMYAFITYNYRLSTQPFLFFAQPVAGLILLNSLVDGIFCGFVGLIFHVVINGGRTIKNDIERVEVLKWSLKPTLEGILSGIGIGVLAGGIYGVVIGALFFVYGRFVNVEYGYDFLDGLTVGARTGLFGGATLGMGIQLRKRLVSLSIESATYVGQGIHSSLNNGILVGSTVAVFNSLVFVLYAIFNMVSIGARRTLFSTFEISTAVYWGICSGVILFLFFGGYTVVQHMILRLILWKEHVTPWKLIPFLDHCVDLIFLRRVGGGYIFVHRLLMEHFSEMYSEGKTT